MQQVIRDLCYYPLYGMTYLIFAMGLYDYHVI